MNPTFVKPEEAEDDSEVWRPFFPSDELPGSFPKNLRRPLADQPNCAEANTAPDEEDDGEPMEGVSGADSDDDYNTEEEDEENVVAPAHKRTTTSKPQDEPNSKRIRMAGGIPPVRKQVVADMDSDDEIIWEMKSQGYKDEPVRDRLIAEGRTKYDPKTIATRYSRIKRVLSAAENERLESDFEDFNENEDDALLAAVAEMAPAYDHELEQAEDRRWRGVHEIMKVNVAKLSYSMKIARERYESLVNGTAIVPIEQDPDPAARATLSAQNKEERRKKRAEEAAQAKIEEEKKQQEREEAEYAIAEEKYRKAAEREQKKVKKEAEKAKKRAKTEEIAAAKRAEAERKAAANVELQLQRDRKKQDVSNQKAAKQWDKKMAIAERRRQTELDKLQRIQRAAEERAARVKAMGEETARKELIRRHMRNAGAETAAPMEAPLAVATQTSFNKKTPLRLNPNMFDNGPPPDDDDPPPNDDGPLPDGKGTEQLKLYESSYPRRTPTLQLVNIPYPTPEY